MPPDDQINYAVKVRLDPNDQATDASVIFDASEKKFVLGTGTGITITNPTDNNILTADGSQTNIIGESLLRWVDGGSGGTSAGKLVIGNSGTGLQLLDVGDGAIVSPFAQLIVHNNSNTNSPFARFGIQDTTSLVIGFGSKNQNTNKKFQIGTYLDQTNSVFTPHFTMIYGGRIGIGEDYNNAKLTNPNSLVEISGNYTYNNASTSPLEVTNLNTTTGNADNRVLVLRMYSVGNPFQGYNNKPRFIDFQSRSGTGTYASRGNIALAPYSSGVFFNTNSDKRLKKNFKPFSLGLPELLQINPLEYEWKDNLAKSRGFIAQELYKIYPDAVYKPPTNDLKKDQWGIDYGKLTPLLVKSIQDQQEIINELEKRINNLENKSK